jgi:hypothetical protein
VWTQDQIETTIDPTFNPENELGYEFFVTFKSMTMNHVECDIPEVFSHSIQSTTAHASHLTLVESFDPAVDN